MKRTARICGALVAIASIVFAMAASAADEKPEIAVKAEASQAKPIVVMNTSMGVMHLELDPDKAPISVDNFLKYVNDGYYKGTIFHRVMSGFMIQGGGFTPSMNKKKTTYPAIKIESSNGLKNEKYSVAMARTNDPNSATSQFFINVVDNPSLDFPGQDGYGYTVFGKVIEGTEVVDKIRMAKVSASGQHQNVPIDPIVITSAKLLEPKGSEEPKSETKKEDAKTESETESESETETETETESKTESKPEAETEG